MFSFDGDCSRVDVETRITHDGSSGSIYLPQPVRFFLLSRVAQLWNKFRILSNSLALRAAALPTFASQAIPIQFSTVSRLSFEQ